MPSLIHHRNEEITENHKKSMLINKSIETITESSTGKDTRFRSLGVKMILLLGTFMLFLALISYKPEDYQLLEGGLPSYITIKNWMGLSGAFVSSKLVLSLGFAAYLGVMLILVCIINRLVNKRVKPVSLSYFVAIFVSIWGMTAILGAFPDLFPQTTSRLNISRLPGGVIGQRFCAPWSVGQPGGWLAYMLNPTGSIMLSVILFAIGFLTVWYYDWLDQSLIWKEALINRWKNGKGAGYGHDEVTSTVTQSSSEFLVQAETAKKAIPTSDPQPAKTIKIVKSKPPAAVPKVMESGNANADVLPSIPYQLPPMDLLNKSTGKVTSVNPQEIETKKQVLQETLDSFSIDGTVGETTSGPRVTLFEIKPAPGVKVERISGLANNIAMNLKAESLRILTPIPGKDTVGIEVPNRVSTAVAFRDLLEHESWKQTNCMIPIVLGKSISGMPVILDLAKAPHLLIAGATGSGKSVCMNTLILSLLNRFSPEELKLIMVDPKVVEFSGYNSLPHLVTPVVTEVKKVPLVLRWVIRQMEWRYDSLSKVGVRNLESFNKRSVEKEPIMDQAGVPIPARLPFIIVIIDELADIMMTAKADVESSLARIAQLARAVGIHVVVATQRPSVNVITGIIKANFPTRIAFQVTSVVDSRTILDGKGAESLLGRGDMLYKPPGGAKVERTQGALVHDDEIERVVEFVSAQARPNFVDDMFVTPSKQNNESTVNDAALSGSTGSEFNDTFDDIPGSANNQLSEEDETLIKKAIEVIRRDRRATISHIQRRLRVGYNKAAIFMEVLEQRGLIGPQIGNAPRQILINDESNMTDSVEGEEIPITDDDGSDMDPPTTVGKK